MKYFISILIFFLPTFLVRYVFIMMHSKKICIKKGAKVGFSFLLADVIVINENVSIGHLNFIKLHSINLAQNVSINHLNVIKGFDELVMGNGAWINHSNKISALNLLEYHKVALIMEKRAKIGVSHVIDMTDNVIMHAGSMLAGSGSQVWTHSFLFTKDGREVRIDAPVEIGQFVYVGSRSLITAGVTIADEVTIGAGTTVSKSLNHKGLYVNQNLRFIEFSADERINQLGDPIAGDDIYRKI